MCIFSIVTSKKLSCKTKQFQSITQKTVGSAAEKGFFSEILGSKAFLVAQHYNEQG